MRSPDGGDVSVPTLTAPHVAEDSKQRKQRVEIIAEGGVGAVLVVALAVALVYICLMRAKRSIRTSVTSSSEPSTHVEWARGTGSLHADNFVPYEASSLRQFSFKELQQATCNFSQNNIVDEGRWGLVYKGLLENGTIVAIKRCFHEPTQFFLQEVKEIGHIQHRNIVKLIGYCQESDQQLLVYEYMSNGNVGNHLYDTDGLPIGKLNLRQRLSIATDAARGLEFLHSLVPPFLHMSFKTRNVLLDDNFAAKVADFGLSKLLCGRNRAGPSSTDCFLDPELSSINMFLERSDVYGFGVFLLEMISGCKATDRKLLGGGGFHLVEQVKATTLRDPGDYIDKALVEDSPLALHGVLDLALRCIDEGQRRPTMRMVVRELELIYDQKLGHQSAYDRGDEIGAVTLGSELFK